MKNVKSKIRSGMTEELNYYFRAACSVSIVIFGFDDKRIKVLCVKRLQEPNKGKWSLPAELVYPNDDIEKTVDDLITEVSGTERFYKKQIRAFAEITRHPLGRVISIGYYCFINHREYLQNNDSELARTAQWFDLKNMPLLAFDHNEIVAAANRRLLTKMSTQLAGFELLPEKFTLSELQVLYESVLGHELDKRNFRRKVMSLGVIEDLDIPMSNWEGSGKAPMLHRLIRDKYMEIKNKNPKDLEIF
jgi:8-oxo-dGTP diphosphatase